MGHNFPHRGEKVLFTPDWGEGYGTSGEIRRSAIYSTTGETATDVVVLIPGGLGKVLSFFHAGGRNGNLFVDEKELFLDRFVDLADRMYSLKSKIKMVNVNTVNP